LSVIIHINGWPGCGKLTIARQLRTLLDGKLLDNHTLLNPAEALFERGDPRWKRVRDEVRSSVLGALSSGALAGPLIITNAVADDPDDSKLYDDYRQLAQVRQERMVAVVLECALEENVRRLTSDGRAEQHKLTREPILRSIRERYQLHRPADVPLLELDISSKSAALAAREIADWVHSAATPSRGLKT
jgi:tRNA uridine 5-carbamoylmethylation protein Kti12